MIGSSAVELSMCGLSAVGYSRSRSFVHATTLHTNSESFRNVPEYSRKLSKLRECSGITWNSVKLPEPSLRFRTFENVREGFKCSITLRNVIECS